MTPVSRDALAAEPELRAKLERLSPECSTADAELTQDAANHLLARIAWCRLAEPGDSTAGALVTALGAEPALRLLVNGTTAEEIAGAVSTAGAELTTRAISEGLERWRPRLDRAATVGDVDRALAVGLGVVTPGSAFWPPGFDDLGEHRPVALWTRGDPGLLRTTALSVVGARAATGYGTHVTAEIVDGVCQAGVTIVSGAAYGIDAVAHRTALAAEAPTIAVLAGGADRAYPAAHDSLLGRIASDGLVCAEMVPGSAPTRWRFRARNRLIAALSPATLVTEAGLRSGTINTAGHSATLGRALGAVPGPVTSAASAGCHLLIREYGAALVTGAREACELIGLDDRLNLPDPDDASAGHRTPPTHERILDALPLRGGRGLDAVVQRSGLSVGEARAALAELELLGQVRRLESAGGDAPLWALERRHGR